MRERAIKFLSAKLKTLPEDVMTKEVEDYVFAETKKVSIQCRIDHMSNLYMMDWSESYFLF